jgi:peptide/nickel transport system ATP-binding protein
VDLTLRRGEVLALVGESGSGKTTIGRVIVKLTRPTAGTITYEGKDVTTTWSGPELRDYRRRVQIIFQDPYETLDPKQTIYDFVAEPLEVNGLGSAAERRERVLGALDAAGLRPAEDYAARFPHELSGGQRQRVVIAGALVMGPQLIVADEPVSMLDVSIRTELLRLMLALRWERGLTYLFITHDLSLAWVLADRIAVMYLGRIMEIGTAEEVIRTPRNPYTEALVSVAPSPEPMSRQGRSERMILKGETPMPFASRRAVVSIRAARRRSTGAASNRHPCSTSAAATSRHAGSPNLRWNLAVESCPWWTPLRRHDPRSPGGDRPRRGRRVRRRRHRRATSGRRGRGRPHPAHRDDAGIRLDQPEPRVHRVVRGGVESRLRRPGRGRARRDVRPDGVRRELDARWDDVDVQDPRRDALVGWRGRRCE